jgi:hypothetical protein
VAESSSQGLESDVWEPTGQQPVFDFTKVAHMNVGPAEAPIDFFKLFFNINFMSILVNTTELGGRAVSALGVRSRKLSTSLNGQSWDG